MVDTKNTNDYFVAVPLNVDILYARQDVLNTEHHTLPEIMTWAKERGIIREVGNPTSINISPPKVKRGGKKTVRATVTVPLHVFQRDHDNVLIPLGGHFGILKQAIHRIGIAKKGNYYRREQWDLVSVFSMEHDEFARMPVSKEWVPSIEVMLGKINRSGQEAAYVPFAWQYIEKTTLGAVLRVNRTCPLPLDEIQDALHGLNDIPFGPNKHGSVKIDDEQVKEFATFEEARDYLKAFIKPAALPSLQQ